MAAGRRRTATEGTGPPPSITPAPRAGGSVAPLLAVLGLTLLVTGAVAAVAVLDGAEDRARRDEARIEVEREAAEVQARIAELESGLLGLLPTRCAEPVTLGALPQRPVEVRCVPVDGSAGPGGDLAALLADPGVQVTVARARDARRPVLSPPTAEGRSALVAPLYAVGDGLAHQPRSDRLEELRASHVASLVAVVDARSVLEPGERRWRLEDGGTVLAGSADVGGGGVTADLDALDRRWTLRTTVDGASWWRPTPLGVAGLVLLGAVLLGLADRQRRVEVGRLSGDAARAEARARAVDALAGLVQENPDLDRILPALAVRLTDELGLAGVSLAVASGAGERELFVLGVPPDRSVRPDPSTTSVAPGETVAVDLHRADRSLAVLRVVAGAPIDAGGLEVLRVAGELVTSTVVAARSIEQQQEAVRRLESLDELKTTFLGVASHELRTPATAVSGLAALLAQRWDDLPESERRAFVERIAANAEALNGLVQDLLDFARLERGDLRLALRPVDLSGVVGALLARLESVWGDHPIELAAEPGVTVLGDQAAIERVLTNLVANAVKFSPAGTPVAVTVRRDGDRAVLVVDDAGPGVPEHEREKVFVRFFRGTGDPVVRTRGVGIGLSVVQDFVAQMGGTVRVDDSPTGGARFVVDLPAHDRELEEVPGAAT